MRARVPSVLLVSIGFGLNRLTELCAHSPTFDFCRATNQDGLTTYFGAKVAETDIALKAGERGPTLLEDHHNREKISAFDHER